METRKTSIIQEVDENGHMVSYHAGSDEPPADKAPKKRKLQFTGATMIADSIRIVGSVNRPPKEKVKEEPVKPEPEKEEEKIEEIEGTEGTENKPSKKRWDGALVSRDAVLAIMEGRAMDNYGPDSAQEPPQYINASVAKKLLMRLETRRDPSLIPQGQPGIFRNEAAITGKIIKRQIKQAKGGQQGSATFWVSCGYRGMKRDEAGYFKKDMVPVYARGEMAASLTEKFSVGDRVAVQGLIQRITVNGQDGGPDGRTVILCTGMERRDMRDIGMHDWNTVRITGVIVSSVAASGGWANLTVKTIVDVTGDEPVKVPYMEKDAEGNEKQAFRKEYHTKTNRRVSYNFVRVFASDNPDNPEESAAEAVEKLLTPGTWVDVTGHVYGRVAPEGYSDMRERERKAYRKKETDKAIADMKTAWDEYTGNAKTVTEEKE